VPDAVEARKIPLHTVSGAIEARKVPLDTVSDASELGRLIDQGVVEAGRVVAAVGKTEGNGGVNDYTRIIASRPR
jgi:cyanuric acid amidohydrolase